ncbi:MAG: GntR family transcriptional regulator [Actinomyces urogenitalis]|uniref:GntR family transcriptional regulator n=1 Tax=Actinomyces urogenitalis TaxID=103621 RepID=UPI002A817069|nr:GntR family transcriptional regulator [Actinomyces urogenitalis]MDY3678878.1 GntR family transcriptional regulator [Actinomyces urogenitalis]
MTAPERITSALRRAIRRGELAPGSLLPQDELARRFEVSRNPLREALAVLAGEGLVELRPGRRAVVRRLTPAEVAELYDLRIAIEPTLAVPVVDAASPRALASLRELAAVTQAAEDHNDWLEANYEFHQALYALAERPRTQALCVQLLGASQPYSALNIGTLGGRAKAEAEHRQMIEAIDQRDPARLAELFCQHLRNARDALLVSMAE